MGLIVDTNVLIAFERRGEPVDVSLLTENSDEFSRIHGLNVVSFS